MSPGEDKQFTLTLPRDDPRKDMAGREATLRQAADHQRARLAGAGRELAQTVGDYNTLADLRAAAHKNLEEEGRRPPRPSCRQGTGCHDRQAATKIEYPPGPSKGTRFMLEDMEQNWSTRHQARRFLAMIKKTRDAYRQSGAARGTPAACPGSGGGDQAEGLKVEEAEVEARPRA